MGPSDSFRMAAITLSLMFGKTSVHHQHAFLAHLHGDIPARARKHIDVALHMLRVDFAIVFAGRADGILFRRQARHRWLR